MLEGLSFKISQTNWNTEQKANCRSNLMPLIESISDTKHQKDVSKYVLSGPAGTITEGLKWSELWGFFFLLLRWAFFKSLHLCAETRKGTLITTQSRSAASVAEWKALNLLLFFLQLEFFTSDRLLFREKPAGSKPVAAPHGFISRTIWRKAQCQTKELHSVFTDTQSTQYVGEKKWKKCHLNMEFIDPTDPTAFSCSAASICLDSTVWFNWALGGLQKRIIYYYLSYRNYEK